MEPYIPPGEPHEYVTCRVCGKRFKTIEASHLAWKHGMTIEDYETMYPDAERVSTRTLVKLGRMKEYNERMKRYRQP